MNYAQQIVHRPQPILYFQLVKYLPMNYPSKMVQRTEPILQFQLVKYSQLNYASKMVQSTEPILKLIIENLMHHNRSTRSSLTIALLILLSPRVYFYLRSGVCSLKNGCIIDVLLFLWFWHLKMSLGTKEDNTMYYSSQD